MSNNDVSPDVVNRIMSLWRQNATIWQLNMFSFPRTINKGFGTTENSTEEELIFLASVSKIVILLELAHALEIMGIQEIPMTYNMLQEAKERDGKWVRAHPELYAQAAIPLTEVFRAVATTSNNSFTREVKELRMKHIGQEALADNYRAMAPGYEMLETTEGNRHWVQSGPNTGYISKMANLLELLVLRYQHDTVSEYEAILVECLMNNPYDFGFCFTHSELGQSLIRKGYRIFEKTGYYPGVTWVSALAEQDYPVLLVLATVVTILSPEGEVKTFWMYHNIEVPVPWETIVENGITFPNEEGKWYKRYISRIIGKLRRNFRKEITRKVSKALNL